MNAVIVIPARYASTRLPGKPLLLIAGKPMIQHVWERACETDGAARVIVATDDQRVFDTVAAFGGEAMMTSPDHASGTDRLAEVATRVPADLYLNLQGDEPLVRPADLVALLDAMRLAADAGVGTLAHLISSAEAEDHNNVKVVTAANGDALYFSRAKIPYVRDPDDFSTPARYLKHLGVYAYRADILAAFATLPRPMLENVEKLEQLRMLHAGIRIRVIEVEPTGPGVDTPECLENARRTFENGPHSQV